ncbi:MAG: glycerol-3-phosphate 1-O-acyltransferase PlsY [Gammaproteobacteria bacterium]|nr:glycerol-3-phosphate 1-O-acyltransferase PlsY [Gammaproteobacteria bacterium]
MSTGHLLVLLAYLLGSLSSAVLVCRLAGLPDPREGGSGNPGATNVLRLGGKKLAAVTLAGDLLKGLVPVLVGQALGLPPVQLALVGLAAFIGHLFPVFFRFRGGKGVATSLGVLIGLDWVVGLATVATWLAVAFAARYSSLAALVSTALAPAWVAWRFGALEPAIACAVMTGLLFWRHAANIRRLAAGEEPRIGDK